jgi:hypothetical protein
MHKINGNQAPKSVQQFSHTGFDFRGLNAKFQQKQIQAKSLKTCRNHGKKAKQLTFTLGLTKL